MHYYITPCEFFTTTLADGLSLESEWQQISSGLQDSSQYYDRPQQCCSLNDIRSFLDFQILEPSYQAKCINYYYYCCDDDDDDDSDNWRCRRISLFAHLFFRSCWFQLQKNFSPFTYKILVFTHFKEKEGNRWGSLKSGGMYE